MPIADWTVDFNLRSRVFDPSSTVLPFNQPVTFPGGEGIYLLNQGGCKLGPTVRAQKEDVPQEDGSILHCRYVTGMEMTLAIQFWESTKDAPACDALLQEMLDEIMGYLYGLINAEDDDGRISWQPINQNARMLDDVRLLTYPEESHPDSGVMELTVTLDTQWPYVEDLTQLEQTIPGNVTNGGNRPTYPVWKIYGPVDYTTLENTDTGEQFSWDGSRPGTDTIGPGDYLEIDTFKNTIYKNGVGSNLKAGVVMESSDFFPIRPGTWPITLSEGGAASKCLINAAWA